MAVALGNSNQLKSSTDLLLLALDARNNSESVVTIYRNLGANNYRLGNIEEGRKFYRKAVTVFEDGQFKSPNPIYKLTTHALTEMFWAQQEALSKNCAGWKEHLGKAYAHSKKISALRQNFPGVPDPIKGQIDKTAS